MKQVSASSLSTVIRLCPPELSAPPPGATDSFSARGRAHEIRRDQLEGVSRIGRRAADGRTSLVGAVKCAVLTYLAGGAGASGPGRAAGNAHHVERTHPASQLREAGWEEALTAGRKLSTWTEADPSTTGRSFSRGLTYLPAIRRDERRMHHRTYQLVVARYDEDISWLLSLPKVWRLTIYNTGPDDLDTRADSGYEVVRLPNSKFGKEGLIFTQHIIRNYGFGLADYTVFAQANPFEHNEFFNDLLWHPSLLLPVQTMTTKFSEAVPPKSVRDIHSPDPWYRSDRFSLFSMDSIYFKDCCVHSVGTIFRETFNLSADVNLVAYMFDSIGLPGWVPEDQEIGSCSYGGMVGVSRAAIVQHPRRIYDRIAERLEEHIMVGYIIERMWLMLFGGPNYVDRDLDPFTVVGDAAAAAAEGQSS